jgi:hypothetical protein
MAWYDFFGDAARGLGKGLGKAASGVGKFLGDPFYEDDEERRMRMILGVDPAGEMSGFTPNFKPRTDVWDVLGGVGDTLGDVGKVAGRAGMSIGRNLPYVGPLVQAGEYGVLKGLGKENSDWAQGNVFAEREWSMDELTRQRAFDEQERQHELGLMPVEKEAKVLGNQLTTQEIETEQKRQAELNRKIQELDAMIAAKIKLGGTLEDYEVQEMVAQRKQLAAELEYKKAQTSTEYKQGDYYAEGRNQAKDPIFTYENAVELATKRASAKATDPVMGLDQAVYDQAFDEAMREYGPMIGKPSSAYRPAQITPSISRWSFRDDPNNKPLGGTGATPPARGTPGATAGRPAPGNIADDFSKIDESFSVNGYEATRITLREDFDAGKITWQEFQEYMDYLEKISKPQRQPIRSLSSPYDTPLNIPSMER